jgi:HEAT repeat protein
MTTKAYKLDEELRTGCGHALEEILERRSDEDYHKLKALLDPDTEVETVQRQNALHLLGRWGNPDAVSTIVQLIPKLDQRDLINAINALGQLGGPDAFRTIVEHEHHPSADVRRFVASALNRIGTKEALEKLKAMGANDESDLVRTKAKRLMK